MNKTDVIFRRLFMSYYMIHNRPFITHEINKILILWSPPKLSKYFFIKVFSTLLEVWNRCPINS